MNKRQVTTVAVSPATYDEIAEKLSAQLAAPINQAGAIDMTGTILVRGPEPAPQPLAGHRPLSTVTQKVKNRGR